MDTFHERVRAARTALGLSMQAAAERVGVSRQTWWTWERFARPTADRLRTVARSLEMTVDELLGHD